MPRSSHALWSAVTDDLYTGPTALEPGPSRISGDTIARVIIWPLVVVFVLVVVVLYAVFTSVRVDGDSMLPTLHDNDRVLLTKSYDSPKRGDVVVVDVSRTDEEDRILKRLVALPGDTVAIDDDVATVNGVTESPARLVRIEGYGETRSETPVPAGYGFILGDNRAVSLDSRFIGPVELARIKARVAFVYWPPENFGPVR